MLENIGNTITRLATNLLDKTWLIAFHHVPDMSAIMGLPWPWQRPLPSNGPSNGALDIQQLWASGGGTREPILMKFGMQQQVRTAMTVMRSNINFFLNSKWRTAAMLEIYSKCHNLPIPMDRLGRNLGGYIPSCPRHVRHDAVDMATAAAYQRRIEHSAVMSVLRPNA